MIISVPVDIEGGFPMAPSPILQRCLVCGVERWYSRRSPLVGLQNIHFDRGIIGFVCEGCLDLLKYCAIGDPPLVERIRESFETTEPLPDTEHLEG